MFYRADAIIREEFEQNSKILNPEVVTIDFELALIGAVQSFWPEAQIQGCFVHFVRTQISNLKKMDFMNNEKKKLNYQLLTLISVLAFIDSSKIDSLFESIKGLEHFAEYESYFQYFEKTWLFGNFTREMWNTFNKLTNKTEYCEKLKHSNNTIESFHSLLNFILKKSHHPTIVEFVEGMKDVEANAKMNLNYYQNKTLVKVLKFICCYFYYIGN